METNTGSVMELSSPITPFYLDKALWVAILGPLCIILSSKLGITLDPATIAGIILPVLAYIVSHKAKSASVANANTAAMASVLVEKIRKPIPNPSPGTPSAVISIKPAEEAKP